MGTPGTSDNEHFEHEFNLALLNHQLTKAKILVVIFLFILLFWVGLLIYFATTTDWIGKSVSIGIILLGPAFLMQAIFVEGYSILYFQRLLANRSLLTQFAKYVIMLVEISFPTLVVFFISLLPSQISFLNEAQILNAPAIFIYFIMIIFSSLQLDFRLSVFAGMIAAVEYWILSFLFLLLFPGIFMMDIPNGILKNVLFITGGIAAGFVSQKIRNYILLSLKAKHDLIYNLDKMVKEQTLEIRHQKEDIEKQNRMLEQKNRYIVESMNYAQRIQQRILPSTDIIYETLKQSFIFYQPKDIVSGDFYFFAIKNGKVLLGAVDCTGHGVPGALMSMVSIEQLNRIVHTDNITSPRDILNQLNKSIRQVLKQNDSSAATKDGMDIAICSLDNENMEMEYAGAHRPLLFIRNGQLTEIKANKMGIGGFTKEDYTFNNHLLKLRQGDTFYLCTDGIIDQFGGLSLNAPKGKKYMAKQFKQLLLNIHHKEMIQQKDILHQNINRWKGKLPQTDDMLVMGVRV